MRTMRHLTHIGMALVAVALLFGVPAEAQAGSCSVTCSLSSCSASAWMRRVYCFCSNGGSNGWARCGTGRPSRAQGAIDKARLPGAGMMFSPEEEDLLVLEDHILRAYELGLYGLGDAASRVYEGLVTGDVKLYLDALGEHEEARSQLAEEELELLEVEVEQPGR